MVGKLYVAHGPILAGVIGWRNHICLDGIVVCSHQKKQWWTHTDSFLKSYNAIWRIIGDDGCVLRDNKIITTVRYCFMLT